MLRGWLWVHCREVLDNGGYIAINGRDTRAKSGKVRAPCPVALLHCRLLIRTHNRAEVVHALLQKPAGGGYGSATPRHTPGHYMQSPGSGVRYPQSPGNALRSPVHQSPIDRSPRNGPQGMTLFRGPCCVMGFNQNCHSSIYTWQVALVGRVASQDGRLTQLMTPQLLEKWQLSSVAHTRATKRACCPPRPPTCGSSWRRRRGSSASSASGSTSVASVAYSVAGASVMACSTACRPPRPCTPVAVLLCTQALRRRCIRGCALLL